VTRVPGNGPQITVQDVAAYLDDLVKRDQFRDIDIPGVVTIVNGLQVEHGRPLNTVAAAVDCTLETIRAAARAGAQPLVVHHGVNPQNVRLATAYREALTEHGIALSAPTDRSTRTRTSATPSGTSEPSV
jgi:putative NIF3 family GTP cyclohydrolase 1 type 2